jgi:hypothetical protein
VLEREAALATPGYCVLVSCRNGQLTRLVFPLYAVGTTPFQHTTHPIPQPLPALDEAGLPMTNACDELLWMQVAHGSKALIDGDVSAPLCTILWFSTRIRCARILLAEYDLSKIPLD